MIRNYIYVVFIHNKTFLRVRHIQYDDLLANSLLKLEIIKIIMQLLQAIENAIFNLFHYIIY